MPSRLLARSWKFCVRAGYHPTHSVIFLLLPRNWCWRSSVTGVTIMQQRTSWACNPHQFRASDGTFIANSAFSTKVNLCYAPYSTGTCVSRRTGYYDQDFQSCLPPAGPINCGVVQCCLLRALENSCVWQLSNCAIGVTHVRRIRTYRRYMRDSASMRVVTPKRLAELPISLP